MFEMIENKEEWNALVLKNPVQSGAFLGSWEWGEFQRAAGRKVYRFASEFGHAQVIENFLPLGKKYWFISRGALFTNQKGAGGSFQGTDFPMTKDGLSTNTHSIIPAGFVKFPEGSDAGPKGNRTPQGWLTSHQGSPNLGPNTTDPLVFYHKLVGLAKDSEEIFIRFEPITMDKIPLLARNTLPVSPPATLIIDITKSEDELLSAMHEKTRYNIRLAERKGVGIRKQDPENKKLPDFFWDLLRETAKRGGFRPHPRIYYEKMLEIPWIELWTAEWDGKILAAGIWAYFGNAVTYLHGASSSEYRNVMAPYLLHWKIMLDAKARGFRNYDFWGISLEAPSAKHQAPSAKNRGWAGMTRFKTGFGGKVIEFPGAFDLPISPFWYNIYKLVRVLRRSA